MPRFRSNAAYRIAVTYAAIYAWTILLVGAALYFFAYVEFEGDPRREIAQELDRLAALERPSALLRELQWRQAAPDSNRFVYRLVDRDGKEIALDGRSAQAFTASPIVAREPGPVNQFSESSGTLAFANGARLAITRVSPPVGRLKTLIFQTFAAASLTVMAVSAVSGLALVWYLRRRLRPISATADAIAAGDVNWRVPVKDPGDEFDTAGRAINLMLDRITGLMDNLRQVSSDIAHDLRKPLMRLLLQTDRLGRVDGAEQRIFELGDEMLALFNGILRIAEVEGGGLERGFKRIDLSALMNDVAESFEPALADSVHSSEWAIEPDVAVMGNRELLAQLASNLLDNARIHTPARSTVRLGLTASQSEARLWVEDDGPGVPEGDRDKLLQRFFRAEASRTTPGNGLGLSLVAAVAHAHGGTVQIEDAEPGLRIVVYLPRVA